MTFFTKKLEIFFGLKFFHFRPYTANPTPYFNSFRPKMAINGEYFFWSETLKRGRE